MARLSRMRSSRSIQGQDESKARRPLRRLFWTVLLESMIFLGLWLRVISDLSRTAMPKQQSWSHILFISSSRSFSIAWFCPTKTCSERQKPATSLSWIDSLASGSKNFEIPRIAEHQSLFHFFHPHTQHNRAAKRQWRLQTIILNKNPLVSQSSHCLLISSRSKTSILWKGLSECYQKIIKWWNLHCGILTHNLSIHA